MIWKSTPKRYDDETAEAMRAVIQIGSDLIIDLDVKRDHNYNLGRFEVCLNRLERLWLDRGY